MKNSKGVTLIALIITIIVMLIIMGVTIPTGYDVLKNTQVNRTKTNLYLIRARASVLLEDYLFDGTDNLGAADSKYYIEVGFKDKEDPEISEQNGYLYYVWDSAKLEEEGISTDDVADAERFIIQCNVIENIVDVASTKGYVGDDGESHYYILSEM